MRKQLLISALALSLAGCATLGGGGGGSDPAAQLTAAIAKGCGFVPTAATVAQLIAGASGNAGGVVAVQTIATLAAAVCAAVVKPASQRRGAVVVNGVVIQGTFVR